MNSKRFLAVASAGAASLPRIALAAAQVGALLWFARRDGLPLDDAWIHQVVARTFAETGTLGFAPGQFGAAATSYLWAAVLAFNLKWLHVDPVGWAFALNLGASLAAGQTLLSLLWRTTPDGVDEAWWRLAAFGAALVASTGANVLWFAHSGMEASTVIALSLAAVWAATSASPTRLRMFGAGAACALLAWTRPEGAPLGFALAAYALYRKHTLTRCAAIAAPTALAVGLYAWVNFVKTGHALPSTLAGRRWLWLEPVSGAPWADRALDFADEWGTRLGSYTFDAGSAGLAVFLGLAAWGAIRLLRAPNDGLRLLFGWCAGHVAFYATLLPTPGHGGRYQPLVPLLFAACVVVGAAFAAHDLARLFRAGARGARVAGVAALFPWIALSAVTATELRRANALAVDHIRTTELGTGAFLDTLPLDGAIASFDIGGTAWASHRPVLDAGGLSDPATARLLQRGRIWEVLKEHQVRYLVLPEGSERALPVVDAFARRLHLAGNDALRLERIHELETPFDRWAPAIKATWNAAPKQVVYRVDYTGTPGPADVDPPPPDARRPIRDPDGLATGHDRAIAEHMLAVLEAWGVRVDVLVSSRRGTSPQGGCFVQLGRWGFDVAGCADVADPAVLKSVLFEQAWRYLEIDDLGGALKNVAHAFTRARRIATPSFDPPLAPVLPPTSPGRAKGAVFVFLLLGVALASLALKRGARARAGVGVALVLLAVGGCGHDAIGPTTLAEAARAGDVDALTSLLLAGAPVDAQDGDGATALHAAVRAGRSACVVVLLHAGASLSPQAGPRRRTALHDAALEGTPETLIALLSAGADPAARDAFGETPLHLVLRVEPVRATAAAALLLGAGADPRIADARGFSVAHAAAAADAPTLLRGALERSPALVGARSPAGETALDVALRYGSDRAAEALLQLGGVPSSVGALPPLHESARTDAVARAAALIAGGADLERLVGGRTALDVARAHGSRRVEALLQPAATRP